MAANSNEEEIKPEGYQTDVSKMQSVIPVTIAGHRWRQRGTTIVCTSCPFEHARSIEPNKRLVAISDIGEPILRDVSELGGSQNA